jgi:8-oxo-dGTP pyrophosphatase MutT (NUDIX family)
MADLRVIAAAVLSDRRLLLVSKHAAPAIHYLPGGKPEVGEASLDCLAREVREELGCRLVEPRIFAEVRAPAEAVDRGGSVALGQLIEVAPDPPAVAIGRAAHCRGGAGLDGPAEVVI